MQLIKKIIILSCVCFVCMGYSYAQDMTQDNIDNSEIQTAEEDEYDTESFIIDPDSDDAFNIIDGIQKTVNFIEQSIKDNSLAINSFAIYKDDTAITKYDEENQISTVQRFDVCKNDGQNTVPFTFIRQTIYNPNNHAWDYIYERIYDAAGKLIYFVRRYNTYNSGCAEVAFERSEYYYNALGVTIKKTYEIFDSDNNKLDLDNCWMERESYEKYMTVNEFNSKYPLF